MNDRELLRAYVELRDVESLGLFVRRYQDHVLRFAFHLLGDRDVAQDVVQETFLSVVARPERLLEVESCHNWLLGVARNIGLDHERRVARHRKHAEPVAHHRAESSVAAEAIAPAAARAEREEERAHVRAEIAKLPLRERELLLLRIEEGKSYREIAEITGLTATNVGYLLHRAMQRLTHALKSMQKDAP